MPNLPVCHWSSQLFNFRAPSSSDVPILLLHQRIIIWLNLRTGKMKQILCSDWLPEDGPILPTQDSPHWSCKKKSAFWSYNESFIGQASLVMMLDITLILFGIFIYLDFISVHKNAMVNGQYPDLLTARLVNNAYHSIHSLNLSLPCFLEPSKSTLLYPPPSVRIFQPI